MTYKQKILTQFDEKFGKDGPERNCDSIGSTAGCDDCTTNINERGLHRLFLYSALDGMVDELMEKVENWKYQYDNYTTMMNTKKDYEKGQLARELAQEINSLLKEYKHE